MKYLIICFIFSITLRFEVYSQQNKVFHFELLDSIMLSSNSQGLIISKDSIVFGVKINDNYYKYQCNYFPEVGRLLSELENIAKKRRIEKLIYVKNSTIVICFDKLFVVDHNDFKIKSQKTLVKYNKKWYYYDNLINKPVYYNEYIYFGGMPYSKSWHDHLENIPSILNSPEVFSFQIKKGKLVLRNHYGTRRSDKDYRLLLAFQSNSIFAIDTLNNRIFTGIPASPEIEISYLNKLEGNCISFGASGKFILNDSLVDISKIGTEMTSRKHELLHSLIPAYSNLIIDSKSRILYRSYIDGMRIDFDSDSFNAKIKYPKDVCAIDLYMMQQYRMASKPYVGLQLYNLNSNPPDLIIDTLYPEGMPSLKNGYFDQEGYLIIEKFDNYTGTLKKLKYQIKLEY